MLKEKADPKPAYSIFNKEDLESKLVRHLKRLSPTSISNFSLQANLATEVEELKRKAAERQAARQAVEDHQADVSMEPLSAEGIAV